MGKTWRIILDNPEDAYYNMAKDEAILLSYKDTSTPVFRVYSWSSPSISLGYRQRAKEVLNIEACKKARVPFVRRVTGGGAILHYKEITYSIACGVGDLSLPRGVKDSYKALNAFLINFYSSFGLKACFSCDAAPNMKSQTVDFCFLGFEPFDILIDGRKIGGNAQRRLKSIIFQHGSIPFDINWQDVSCLFKNARNYSKAKSITLGEIITEEFNYSLLQKKLMDSFVETFGIDFRVEKTSQDEANTIKDLLTSKYSKRVWNLNDEKTRVA